MAASTNTPEQTPGKQGSNENTIKVFISHRDSKCDECGEELGRQAWITLEENKGALCLACADVDERGARNQTLPKADFFHQPTDHALL